jgi:DNA (cytosine-5)-methyltransferase 1
VSLSEPLHTDPEEYPDVKSAIGHLINRDSHDEAVDPITADGIEPDDPLHWARELAQVNVDRINISEPGRTWEQWVEKEREDLLNKCHKRESGRSFTHQYGRMKWDDPAPTITTQFFNYGAGRFGHPEYVDDNHEQNVNRALSLREGALLQTFPEGYEFTENPEEDSLERIGRHIGNAVPPKLAEFIGGASIDHIKSEHSSVTQLHPPSELKSPEQDFLTRVQQPSD